MTLHDDFFCPAFHVTGYLPHLCPDDDVFRHLAEVYARNHATMWKGQSCKSTATFPNGIINGAQWYTVIGNRPPRFIMDL